jgi:predicted aspartyl protease
MPARALAASVALAAAGCSPELMRPAPEATPPDVPVEMRFERGVPLVEGRLPGTGGGRVWFVIDTGAGDFTLLDESLTTSLRLKHELATDPRLPSANFSTTLEFLEVDGMGRADYTAFVTDSLASRPELTGISVPVQGVLGAGYFRGRCLRFDWASGRFSASHPRVRLARQVPIPLRYGTAGELYATLRVNGSDAVALVDTASATTLVAQELADRIGLAYDRADVTGTRRRASSSAARSRRTRRSSSRRAP